MTTEHVRAGSAWLALREPADAAARSRELVEMLRPSLPTGGLVIHDLGSGTGSMARWLAPQLGGPQSWVLHDRDAELLEQAAVNSPARFAGRAEITVSTRLGDVTLLDPGELAGGLPDHRLRPAGHVHRRRAGTFRRHLCRSGLPGSAHAQRRGPRRTDPRRAP